jgi:hypothetical protein
MNRTSSSKVTTRHAAAAVVCLAIIAATHGVLAANDKKEPAAGIKPTPKMCEALNGSFDMRKNPRPWIGFMIMDQEGNPYPSFWCGGNAGGTIVFAGKVDDLDETFNLNQSGSFSVEFVHTARKHGMYDRLPAGEWMDGIKARPIRLTFTSFTEPVITATKATDRRSDTGVGDFAAGGTVEVTAKFAGTVEVGSRKVPFSGTANLSFMQGVPSFFLRATFTLPGKELGLLGSKGENISVTMYTASVSVLNTPDGKGGFVGAGAADEGSAILDDRKPVD